MAPSRLVNSSRRTAIKLFWYTPAHFCPSWVSKKTPCPSNKFKLAQKSHGDKLLKLWSCSAKETHWTLLHQLRARLPPWPIKNMTKSLSNWSLNPVTCLDTFKQQKRACTHENLSRYLLHVSFGFHLERKKCSSVCGFIVLENGSWNVQRENIHRPPDSGESRKQTSGKQTKHTEMHAHTINKPLLEQCYKS